MNKKWLIGAFGVLALGYTETAQAAHKQPDKLMTPELEWQALPQHAKWLEPTPFKENRASTDKTHQKALQKAKPRK